MAQIESEAKDDPIYGSLGPPKPFLGVNGTEFVAAKFESYMNSLKPVKFLNDENVNTTWSSLIWAENSIGEHMNLPKKDKYYMEHHNAVLHQNTDFIKVENYTEDEDISSTLDSIKDAEHLMGYRGPPPTN